MSKIFCLLFVCIGCNLFGQNIAIGQWRSHMDYSNATHLAEVNDTIYVGTQTGLFYFLKSNHEAYGLSKTNGLKEVEIKTIGWSNRYHRLFIGYNSTNIDMMQNGRVTNVSELQRYTGIIGIKEINAFDFRDKYCFISTSFGITRYNMARNEVKDDFRDIWPVDFSQVNVRGVAFWHDSIFAATDKGVLGAPYSDTADVADLKYAGNWRILLKGNYTCIETFKDLLWVGKKDTIDALRYYDGQSWKSQGGGIKQVFKLENSHNKLIVCGERVYSVDMISPLHTWYIGSFNHGLTDEIGNLYAAVDRYGLYKIEAAPSTTEFFAKPNGPFSQENVEIKGFGDEMWVCHTGVDLHYNPRYLMDGMSIFKNGMWEAHNKGNEKWGPDKDLQDITCIAEDPITKHKFVGTQEHGLMEYIPGNQIKVYKHYNSTLKTNFQYEQDPDTGTRKLVTVPGVVFDQNNNLWASNWRAVTPLHVRTPAGKWIGYNVGSSNERKDFFSILVDNSNQIWTFRPQSGGITVFNHNNTLEIKSDDQYKEIGIGKGNGNLPDAKVNCMAIDKEGQIWIGTNNGIGVFYDPSLVFSKSNFDAQQVWVENGKESGYLLSLETVTAIAVDGGNRKWIGTRKGVYVTSPDGTKILNHYTENNSPLLSDNIHTIGINSITGEVFIGTELGIVSYRANSTESNEHFNDVYAFPNPVRPGYTGPIAINGLVDKTNVKITDITGNMVYETTSEGGLATWNGCNYSGQRANSGVYLVFLSNTDGSETMVTKIMIVR